MGGVAACSLIINHYLAVAELTKSKLYTFDKQQEDAFDAMSKIW